MPETHDLRRCMDAGCRGSSLGQRRMHVWATPRRARGVWKGEERREGASESGTERRHGQQRHDAHDGQRVAVGDDLEGHGARQLAQLWRARRHGARQWLRQGWLGNDDAAGGADDLVGAWTLQNLRVSLARERVST